MRLRRLDLTRYGKFTNYGIDFGARVEARPDLHIIYGPNEAGKSTMLAAYLDLLFGIGGQSKFVFLHSYQTMRIQAVLEFEAATRGFARIKQPANSLRDADDRPIAESAIQAELGGVDRNAYKAMFSLDDEILEKGGESILASKGDVGEMLFSAGAGLADLGRRLIDLQQEGDAFHKSRARSGVLLDLKAKLEALKVDRDRIDTAAADYARLSKERDDALERREAANTAYARAQMMAEALQRKLDALPRLADLQAHRAAIAQLADSPDAPPGWSSELPRLRAEEIKLNDRRESITDAIAALDQTIASLTLDEAGVRLSDELHDIRARRGRYMEADEDLPRRREEVRELDVTVASLLVRLARAGEPDPRRLILPAAMIGELRGLIESRSGIEQTLAAATTEQDEAARRCADAHARLAAMAHAAHDPIGLKTLAVAVAALRNSDHVARRNLAEKTLAKANEALSERLKALAPWRGDADALLAMACPAPATLQRWKSDIATRALALAAIVDEADRLTADVARREAERDAVAATTFGLDDRETAALRAQREEAWARHRRDLSADSADVFETILRREDIVLAGRLAQTAALAQARQYAQALGVARAEAARARTRRDEAAANLAAVKADVAAAVGAVLPEASAGWSADELEAWLAHRSRALAAREEAMQAKAALAEAQDDDGEAVHRLSVALGAAGIAHDPAQGFETLLAAATEASDGARALALMHEALEDQNRAVALRERALAVARNAERNWTDAWTKLCAQCWLGETSAAPSPRAAGEMLTATTDLGGALDARAGLIDRIDKMEANQREFCAAVTAVACRLGPEMSAAPPLEYAHALEERAAHAIALRDRRAAAMRSLAQEHEKRAAVARAHEAVAHQIRAITTYFGVTTLDEAERKMAARARRDALVTQMESAARDIVNALRTSSIEEAERALLEADREALELSRNETKARLGELDAQRQEAYAAHKTADALVEAIGGDAQAAAIEERRRTTLLEIEEGAKRCLQIRLGIIATEQGLRLYRDRHRSSMMARASDAFRVISRGAYSGLATQPGKDGADILIALSALDGGSKEAGDLSKGARFQLYLALRVAGYHEFVRTHAPVPFLADDIMETFDDFRAEEAFKLFAAMAQVGQVIYLTHHRHLCAIAKAVCPDVRIHELPDAQTPTPKQGQRAHA